MANPVIYIIDDEQQFIHLISEYSKLMGYQTLGYSQGGDFFDQNESFITGSIIILDLNMPKMDGIEVMRHMVKTDKVLPLILISGYDSSILHSAEQLAKAYSLDIITTLTKPINFNAFESAIQKHKYLEKNPDIKPEISFDLSEIKDAIYLDQLDLHYQPQIDIRNGTLIGIEALVYWQHPEHGLIYPNLFIPLAESNGLIGEITEIVVKKALHQILLWKSSDLNIRVSINISAENITSLTLPELLLNLLDSHELEPAMLTLEITESTLMGELTTSLDILTRLRMKGIDLSIDDFGTGYSSLSLLYRMPFSELKVDKSFVTNMVNDSEARGIVKTCIMLGHELNMRVVAEGVESLGTLALLNEMGCDIAQGFYIAKPMHPNKIIPWTKKSKLVID